METVQQGTEEYRDDIIRNLEDRLVETEYESLLNDISDADDDNMLKYVLVFQRTSGLNNFEVKEF